MAKYISIAMMFGATAALLAGAGRASDACQDQIGTICSSAPAEIATVCEDGVACIDADAGAQLAVLVGAELPPLTETDLLIAMPIVPGAPALD